MDIYKWILITVCNCFGFIVGITQSQDYCSWETFNPTCEDNEVIIMEKALYGLMKKGRCVERDFGFLGCSADKLNFLDKQCSGLHTCEILVENKEIKSSIPCPDHYLEASYICQKVATVNTNQCNSPVKLQVKSAPNYIASITSKESTCGMGNSPWLLTAQPGQKINLTIIDFSWGDNAIQRVKGGNCDVTYGHILSNTYDDMVDICGGSQRIRHLELVNSHQVQIVFQETAVQSYHFLIQFEAIGCADIVPPKNAWMRKDGSDVAMGCHTNTDMWKLKCIGNHWIGTIGNCSEVIVKQPILKSPQEEFTHHHVTSVTVGCVALIVCCITITVGGYFIKRYKIKMKSGYGQTSSDMYLLPSTQFTTMRPSTNAGNSTMPMGQFTLTHAQQSTNTETVRRPNDSSFSDAGMTLRGDTSPQYFILEPPIGHNENNVM